MKPKRKYRKSKISDEQKEEIALDYLTTPNASYRSIGEKYGIHKMQVRHCIVWHEHNELVAAATNSSMPKFHSPKNKELYQQVKRLARQLQVARLKAEAFEQMIILAEDEFKIPIRPERSEHMESFSNIPAE